MPVLAPVLRVLKLLDGVAVGQAVNKAQRAQLLQPFKTTAMLWMRRLNGEYLTWVTLWS